MIEQLRQSLLQKAQEGRSNKNEQEFTPDLNQTYTIRLLPPKEQGEMFYVTHSYHYLPFGDSVRMLYTLKTYNVNGVNKKDPIDEAVSNWFKVATATNDNELRNLASMIKRKRHFYFNISLKTDDDDYEYKIMIERSNKGKLARILCTTMGIPFFFDTWDNWVDKTSLAIDPNKEYFDLLDLQNGYDFRIRKTQFGSNKWDVSYTDSYVAKKPRPLTKKEIEFYNNQINLKEYVNYETDYNTVVTIFNEFLETIDAHYVRLLNNSSVVNLVNNSVTSTDTINTVTEKVVVPKNKQSAVSSINTPPVPSLDDLINDLE